MAVPELKDRKPGMMTLISLRSRSRFIYSVAAQFIALARGSFWETRHTEDIMLLGHWLEMRSVRQASGALNELAKLCPTRRSASITADMTESRSRLRAQERRPRPRPTRRGASRRMAKVVDGHSDVNEAMITGESKPVHKLQGAKVIAGTINGDGSLRVKVTATGNETALSGICVSSSCAAVQIQNAVLADKAAGGLFYIALAAAFLTGIAWTIADAFNLEVLTRVVTVLVIACSARARSGDSARRCHHHRVGARANGILVRDRLALEAARELTW